MNDLAVYKVGWWNENVKLHAADPSTAFKGIGSWDVYFRSRCGIKYVQTTTPNADGTPVLFAQVMHLEQCQRCAAIVARLA